MLNLLTFLALAAAPALQSAPVESAPTLTVRHSDLDLTRTDHRAELDRRIDRAVEKLCPTTQAGQTTRSLAGLRCRSETLARVAPLRSRAVAQATAPAQVSSAAR
jgi:UrcA family protein